MTPQALRRKIKGFEATPPITHSFERGLTKQGSWSTDGVWYRSQKEHWLGWLSEYDGPGAYGRKTSVLRSAEFAYNHVVCPPMVLWLGEASGVKTSLITQAKKEALGASRKLQGKCAAIRGIVPWSEIEESLLNSVATDNLMRDYSIKELLRAVRRLPATAPQSDKLSKGGYETHQDHWIGWLKEYDGPGYYGRSDWSVDARAVYQRLANGHILVWLNEAAGEDPKRIRAAITAMKRHGNGRTQTEAKIVRSHLSWEQVATLLFK
jgi:hypothetical protein